LYTCELCFGPLEVDYDYARAQASLTRSSIQDGPPSLWRYQALLPNHEDIRIDLGAGWTPLRRARRLGEILGIDELWLKDDTRNPTGSFKDRVVSVAMSNAAALGFSTVACASTGNLATSVAAHAAYAGWPSVIVIPSNLEKPKVAMTSVFGGTVLAIEGNYDDANRLCLELLDTHPQWAFVNINLRPYYSEGSKTLAYEIAEQLGWHCPAQVVVPVASGSQFTKVAKGFDELLKLGLVDGPRPTLFAAQAAGCSPVATAFADNTYDVIPQRPNTIAKSLAIGNPADAVYVLEELNRAGACGSVPDDEVLECISLLASSEGVFGEPAAGVTIASLRQLLRAGAIDPTKSVVAIISGHGLKAIDAIETSANVTTTIDPSLAAAESALHELALS
jgi:threonine synthase